MAQRMFVRKFIQKYAYNDGYCYLVSRRVLLYQFPQKTCMVLVIFEFLCLGFLFPFIVNLELKKNALNLKEKKGKYVYILNLFDDPFL